MIAKNPVKSKNRIESFVRRRYHEYGVVIDYLADLQGIRYRQFYKSHIHSRNRDRIGYYLQTYLLRIIFRDEITERTSCVKYIILCYSVHFNRYMKMEAPPYSIAFHRDRNIVRRPFQI